MYVQVALYVQVATVALWLTYSAQNTKWWWRRLRVQLGLLQLHWRVHVLQPVHRLLLLLSYYLHQFFWLKPGSTPH